MYRKKSLVLVFTFLLIFSSFSNVIAASTNNEKVQFLIDKGWVTGHDDGNLGLEENITRAQFTKMVVVISGLEENLIDKSKVKSDFSDLDLSHWANGYINIAIEKGLVKGYPEGNFLPENKITYAEIVTVLARLNPDFVEGQNSSGNWYDSYVSFANNNGYFSGISDLDFTKAGIREKTFEIIYNFVKDSGKEVVISQPRPEAPKKEVVISQSRPEAPKEEVVIPQPRPELPKKEKETTIAKLDHRVFQETMLDLVNDLRRSVGVDSLSYSLELQRGTTVRAEELTEYGDISINGVSHVRPDGSSSINAFDYIHGSSKYLKAYGENLASNYASNKDISSEDFSKNIARVLFEQWKNSPGHYKNMVNDKLTEFSTAVGYNEKTEKVIGVQIFGIFSSGTVTPKPASDSKDSKSIIDLNKLSLSEYSSQIKNLNLQRGDSIVVKLGSYSDQEVLNLTAETYVGHKILMSTNSNQYAIIAIE